LLRRPWVPVLFLIATRLAYGTLVDFRFRVDQSLPGTCMSSSAAPIDIESGGEWPPIAQNPNGDANDSITTGAHDPVLYESATFLLNLPAGDQFRSKWMIVGGLGLMLVGALGRRRSSRQNAKRNPN